MLISDTSSMEADPHGTSKMQLGPEHGVQLDNMRHEFGCIWRCPWNPRAQFGMLEDLKRTGGEFFVNLKNLCLRTAIRVILFP